VYQKACTLLDACNAEWSYRARVHFDRGTALSRTMSWEQALIPLREALHCARLEDDGGAIGAALCGLAVAYAALGREADCKAALDDARWRLGSIPEAVERSLTTIRRDRRKGARKR
jgi:hypothetical protein